MTEPMKNLDGIQRKFAIVLVIVLMVMGAPANAITVQFEEGASDFTAEEREIIRTIAEKTEKEVRKLLPTLDEEIVLTVASGEYVIAVTGEAGMALSPRNILWTVDSERPEGVVAIAEAQLRYTLFHEFHHLVRGWVVQGGEPRTSFMDGVVSEGMATVFARDFAGENVPWAKYPDDVESWVSELQSKATGAKYNEWMFLHSDGRQWIGYRAGTYLVDLAIQNTGKTAVDLVKTPAGAVIELGKSPP